MSRLQSEKKEIAEPSEPLDVDVPCFVIEDTPDPSLILPDLLRNAQLAHCHTHPMLTGFGADTSIDMDNHGLIGVIRHTGEFELVIPPIDCPLPLSIVTEAPVYPGSGESIRDGDALDLRRGEVFSRSHILRPGPGPLSSTLPPVLAQILTEFSDLEVSPVEDLPQMIQLEELRHAQEEDSECRALFQSEAPNSIIDVNAKGVLIRKAPLDGSEQILVPQVFRPRLLHLEHYPARAGHPGISRMYSSTRRRYLWKDMYRDVESTVRNCTVCANNREGVARTCGGRYTHRVPTTEVRERYTRAALREIARRIRPADMELGTRTSARRGIPAWSRPEASLDPRPRLQLK
jgi:hypothetical protein